MRRGERDVAEEWLLAVPLHEAQRVLHEHIDDEALRLEHHAVFFERRIKILAPMAAGVADILVKTARTRVIRPLAAIVPLSERTGRVACGFEIVRDGLFIGAHAFLALGNAQHAAAAVITAGQKLRACRRTQRADEKAVKRGPAARQFVDVRRLQVGIAIDRVIAPACVIGQKHDNVGCSRQSGLSEQNEQETGAKDHGRALTQCVERGFRLI